MYTPYPSRAWASRVTEVSREGRTYKDKGEPIGTTPDRLAGRVLPPWSLGSICPWRFLLSTSLSDAATVSWSDLLLTFLNLDRFSGWLLFVWTFFLPDISWSWHPCPMMPLSLDPACACHLLEVFVLDISEFSASLNLGNPSGCLLFVRASFSPRHFNILISFVWHCLLIWLALVIFESWQRLSCRQLWSQRLDILLSPDASGLRLSSLNRDSRSLADS